MLRVGTTGDYKPFTFRNPDGSYTGADMVMAQRLAQKLGVKLEIVPTTWATLLPDFVAGKYDMVMGGVSVLPARAAKGDYSTTVNTDGKRPIARCADKERFTSLAAIDKPDVRVIVNPGASNEVFAKQNFPHAQITVYPDNVTIFDQIVARQGGRDGDGRHRGGPPGLYPPRALRRRREDDLHDGGQGVSDAEGPGAREIRR